jgi:hypothetical protein
MAPFAPGVRSVGSATVLVPRPALIVAAIALLLAGCGGGSVDTSALEKQLTTVADAVDACVAKTNDARKCASAAQVGKLPSDVKLGSGDGEIQIHATKALRYQLVAKAGDKVQFGILAQPVGARKRVCLPAGEGSCPKGGVW